MEVNKTSTKTNAELEKQQFNLNEILPLRAENLEYSKLNQIDPRSLLLPSQIQMMEWIYDYLTDKEYKATEPAFYLTGQKGVGKTLTALFAVYQATKEDNEKVVAFFTFGTNGNISTYQGFDAKLIDAKIVVLNDLHYHLEAIINGRIEREDSLNKLFEIFEGIKNKGLKAIVISDQPLASYTDKINDDRFTKIVRGSQVLAYNELITGVKKDLEKIALNLGVNFSEEVMESIAQTNRNIRFMLKLAKLYKNEVGSLDKLSSALKQGQPAPIRLILDFPRLVKISEFVKIMKSDLPADIEDEKKFHLKRVEEGMGRYIALYNEYVIMKEPLEKLKHSRKAIDLKTKKLFEELDIGIHEAGSDFYERLSSLNWNYYNPTVKNQTLIGSIRNEYRALDKKILKERQKLEPIEAKLSKAEQRIKSGVSALFGLLNEIASVEVYINVGDGVNRSAGLEVRIKEDELVFDKRVISANFMQAVISGEMERLLSLKYGQRE